MAKIDNATVNNWRSLCETWLQNKYSKSLDWITTGKDAWTVAHAVEIPRQAYALGRDIHDAHIRTALEKIFPKAVFRDKKVY